MKSITKGIAITLLLLLTAALLVMPVAARGPTNKDIVNGDTIFINEKCLNIAGLSTGNPIQSLVYYTDLSAGAVGKRISSINVSCFDVDAAYGLDAYAGQLFYAVDSNQTRMNSVIIDKASLQIDLVLDAYRDDSVNGKSITRDTKMVAKVTNNVADAMNQNASDMCARVNTLINVEFTTPDGGKLTNFGGVNVGGRCLVARKLYFGPFDLTNERAGQYTVMAKWPGSTATLPASDFFGKGLDSNTGSFTILSQAVSIETNKDTVIRGNDFVLTVTGEAKKDYLVYLRKAGIGSNEYPAIRAGQSNVGIGVTPASIDPAVSSKFNLEAETGVTTTYATVNTDAGGKRSIEFRTTADTKDKMFTIKVYDPLDVSKYDSVDVTVKKGEVTVDAAGTKVYYIGAEVKLFGTNTDSQDVYLFITGPNLPTDGGQILSPKEDLASVADFKDVSVNSDNTWEFKWPTDKVGIDAGTYTIYAVSVPRDKGHLENATYDTVSVTLLKPFVNASLPALRLAQGDIIKVTGTAEGKPSAGVNIWLLGKNMFRFFNPSVNDDLTFEQKIERDVTKDLTSGEYFVVVQHPMYNGEFDIFPIDSSFCYDTVVNSVCVESHNCSVEYANPTSCCNLSTPDQTSGFCCNTWQNITKQTCGCPGGATDCVFNRIAQTVEFNLQGPDALMGSDAALALQKALDSPNVDDSYTKLYFTLEAAWISIPAIPDQTVGDKFTISGTTNLAVDDTLQITVTSASFRPTEKSATEPFSGTAGTVNVVKGTGVDNAWSFPVDTAGFKADLYNVDVECIETGTKSSAQFTVLEFKPTVPPTTVVVTTVPPTTVPKTTVPVATATTTPGFGAAIALIGLGAVAVLVLRRH